MAVGKLSGAVGTYADIDPYVEEYVCKKMGLAKEVVATQVVQRDHHAEYITTLGVIAGTLAQMALEVRHLQRTEVREAEEYFSPKQKGSSAMPHKRNPVKSERICGMARLIQGYSSLPSKTSRSGTKEIFPTPPSNASCSRMRPSLWTTSSHRPPTSSTSSSSIRTRCSPI